MIKIEGEVRVNVPFRVKSFATLESYSRVIDNPTWNRTRNHIRNHTGSHIMNHTGSHIRNLVWVS